MSRYPTNSNRSQEFLYRKGVKRLGAEANVLYDTNVRRAGVAETARDAITVGVMGAGAVGLYALAAWGIDHSPTMTYQERHQQEHTTTSTRPELGPDPRQATIAVAAQPRGPK